MAAMNYRTLLLAFCLLSSSVAAQPSQPRVLSPHFPLWRQSQEPLDFDVEAAPGQAPQLQLGERTVVLEEVTPGKFHGRLTDIPALSADQNVVLNGQSVGQVRTLSGPRQVVQVISDQAVFRNGPHPDFDRYTPVVSGVRFEVLGREGDWLHVSPPDAYIHEKDVKALPAGSSLAPSKVHVVRIKEDAEGGAEVRVRLYAPCAWQIHPEPGPPQRVSRLCVDFPGVPMKMHEMGFAQEARRIPNAILQASPQGTRLELEVADGLWGYQVRWEKNDMVLSLAPPLRADSLRGVRITLDAGHGGTDLGAPGPGGTHEKDHNFAVTCALQKELEDAGAVVTMTRSGDAEVEPPEVPQERELAARVRVSEQSRAQLFISIHHNALANLADGRKAHGVHAYYYYPYSGPLALAVARPLAEAIGEESYLHFWRSFHLTRQSGRPAILIECNFVSNPEVERDMLMREDYPQQAARGIRRGVQEYLKAYGTR